MIAIVMTAATVDLIAPVGRIINILLVLLIIMFVLFILGFVKTYMSKRKIRLQEKLDIMNVLNSPTARQSGLHLSEITRLVGKEDIQCHSILTSLEIRKWVVTFPGQKDKIGDQIIYKITESGVRALLTMVKPKKFSQT